MPTYEYECRECGNRVEVIQSIHDEALTECPNCKGELRKVFGSIGIAFKGQGFYKNDNRGKKPSDSPSPKKEEKKSSSPDTSSGTSSAAS